MIIMHMVQVPVVEIVHMIPMRDHGMQHVIRIMHMVFMFRHIRPLFHFRISICYLNYMFIHMAVMGMMHVPVMEVVHMSVMHDGLVSAIICVGVAVRGVIGMVDIGCGAACGQTDGKREDRAEFEWRLCHWSSL